MKAFINTKMTREQLKQRVYAHADADEIVQGQYWENGKGCLVGCWVHSDDHNLFENLFGIDKHVAYLADAIFEKLGNIYAKRFVIDVFESIKKGADTSLVWPKFAYWMLADQKDGVIKYNDCDEIKEVAELFKRLIDGEDVKEEWINYFNAADAFSEAASEAADAAASAAAFAPCAAVSSSVAAARTASFDASFDASAVAAVADDAAVASADAAAVAAAFDIIIKQRNKLLELLRNC